MAADQELVLLTGASGFVGKQVLASLLARDCRVRLACRPGRTPVPSLGNERVEVVGTTDLFTESAERLEDLCRGCDKVIHVAWYAEPGKYLTSPLNIDCLNGTIRLAQAFIATGGKRFVGIGTCFEYDLDARVLDTRTPLRPHTIYAACKASTYQILSTLFDPNLVEFVWCRLFYLYGEGEHEQRLVPYVRSKLSEGKTANLTSGRQVRDYLEVTRAGQMIVEATFSGQQGAINICSGKPITVRQLAEQVADEFGRRDLLNFGARADGLTDPICVLGIQ